MKKLETTKLWYNRYLYKIVIRVPCVYLFTITSMRRNFPEPTNKDEEDLLNLIHNKDIKTRSEGSLVAVFTNDTDFLAEMSERFAKEIQEIWQPSPEREHLLKNANTIIVKEKPAYPIKVTMNDRNISSNFAKWVKANPDKIKIGDAAYRAINRGWMTGGLYFYIRNDKVLSLVNLMISENIRRVDRLVCEA